MNTRTIADSNSKLANLKQMLLCCQEIRELLQADKDSFVQNDFAVLDQSNRQKTEILGHLSRLTNEVNMYVHERANVTEEDPEQAECNTVLDALKTEISACYKHIVINSQIVAFNLQQIKDIWDKLAASQAAAHCVYDDKGSIK